MFKTKKENRRSGQKAKSDLSSLGIFEIPDFDGNIDKDLPDDEDDPDLENELDSLVSGSSSTSAKAPPKRKIPKVMPANDLDAMVAASLRDDPSDDSLSGDEDDPDLLAELNEVTGKANTAQAPQQMHNESKTSDIQSLLLERIEMYKEAEINAKSVGDAAKTRRLSRGLKTLNDLLKKAQRGGAIDESEIPMPVAKTASKPPPPATSPVEPVSSKSEDDPPTPSDAHILRPAPPVPSSPPQVAPSVDTKDLSLPGPSKESNDDNKQKTLAILAGRRDEYKKAAVIAKRAGDTPTALGHVKLIKQFEAVIAGVEAGHPIDLSTMPPPPDLGEPVQNVTAPPIPPRKKDSENQVSGQFQPTIVVQEEEPNEEGAGAKPQEPLTVLGALEQRMAKFVEQEESAKRDGNASKMRRMGRIVKQYQDAIKLHKAGKPIPVDELPTPPGFPPIPVEGSSANAAGPVPSPAVSPSKPPPSPVLSPKHLVPEGVQKPSPASSTTPSPSRSPVPTRRAVPGASQAMGGTSRVDKQLASLIARQKQLKEAAIKAKRNGDIEKAKEYLRQAKGLDPMIEAANSGIRVDMSSIPVAPEAKESVDTEFDMVMLSDCVTGSDVEMYDQLITDLQTQFKLCMETRNHFKAIGDIGSANRFEQLAVYTKKDLDTVRVSKSRNDPIPKFHYEKRKFSIVRCNIDLNDNDLELSIVQGINYNVPNPKEVDTYVRYEFPFPNDEIRRDKTAVIYNTNNPTYNATFTIPIQRTVRSFQRIFKRHAIKFEVWSRGGFLRSDTLIGTTSVKLQPLETKCSIHDSFDLMEGRKTVGGKLEIKIRLRNPIQTKQVEQVEEKWLVVD